MLGRVRRHSFPCVTARIGPLRLPRRMPAQTLVSLVFGLRCPTERTGIPGFWVILFERAVHHDPARPVDRVCHRVTVDDVALQQFHTLSAWHEMFSGLTSYGSFVRVPTHRRARCRPASPSPLHTRRKAHYRPAWPAWSDGFRTRWMTLPYFLKGRRTFLPYGPAFPGRTKFHFRSGDPEKRTWNARLRDPR